MPNFSVKLDSHRASCFKHSDNGMPLSTWSCQYHTQTLLNSRLTDKHDITHSTNVTPGAKVYERMIPSLFCHGHYWMVSKKGIILPVKVLFPESPTIFFFKKPSLTWLMMSTEW